MSQKPCLLLLVGDDPNSHVSLMTLLSKTHEVRIIPAPAAGDALQYIDNKKPVACIMHYSLNQTTNPLTLGIAEKHPNMAFLEIRPNKDHQPRVPYRHRTALINENDPAGAAALILQSVSKAA